MPRLRGRGRTQGCQNRFGILDALLFLLLKSHLKAGHNFPVTAHISHKFQVSIARDGMHVKIRATDCPKLMLDL